MNKKSGSLLILIVLLLGVFLAACESEVDPAETSDSGTISDGSEGDEGGVDASSADAATSDAATTADSEGTDAPETGDVDPWAAPPAGEGFQLTMEFVVEEPYGEAWICDVYTMPNEDIALVNRVEMQQTPGTHHLTLSTLGLTPGEILEPGRYDCPELYGESSLMEDQIMFFGSQGEAESVMQLPDGVAATIPPGMQIIHEMHFLNLSDEPATVFSRLNAWTISQAEFDEGIWGGSVRDEHIVLPPQSTHSEWSRCVMNEDVEMLFVASHTHELATEFTVAHFDGEETGEVFYSNDDWHSPKIVQYDPPLIVPAGTGFEWTCTWENPTDETINYGPSATDEMCNLAIVHTPFNPSALCEVVETSDGVLWSP